MTGYVVHYSDGDIDRNESVPATSTSSLITGLTDGLNYTSVEATSQHLSGESCQINITLGWGEHSICVIIHFHDGLHIIPIGAAYPFSFPLCGVLSLTSVCIPSAGLIENCSFT